MANFEKNILIKNISKLMSHENMSQLQLAEILGMSQPNISKALNPKEKKCFTLAQIYELATHFNISIDQLVGNSNMNNYQATTPRATAAFITQLAENHDIKFVPISQIEHIYEPFRNQNKYYSNYRDYDEEIEYPAIIFPSYWDVSQAKTEADWDEATQLGNVTKMKSVNDYIIKFQEIFKLYEKGDLSKETYNVVISDFLSHLE